MWWRIEVCLSTENEEHSVVRTVSHLFLKPEAKARVARAEEDENSKPFFLQDEDFTTEIDVDSEPASDWCDYERMQSPNYHTVRPWENDPDATVFTVDVRGTAAAQEVVDWFAGRCPHKVLWSRVRGGYVDGHSNGFWFD